jgi:uncharacterized membrane protein
MLFLVWLHVFAAVSWIGGSIFLSVILVPVLRREQFASQKALLFRTIAMRFRMVAWGAIVILLLTGPMLLHERGVSIMNPSEWPTILSIKLGLVAVLLLLTMAHDLVIGPRVGRILQIPAERRTKSDHAMVGWSPWIARLSLILALAVLFAAVTLVRS